MTVQAIIDRARELADINNSSFFSSSEELASINESYRDIYEQILNSDDDYFATDWAFLLAALTAVSQNTGMYTIALPNGFYRMRVLQYKSGERWPSVDKYNPQNEAELDNPSYRLKGSTLRLYLPSEGSYTSFRAVYFPAPTVYTSGATDIIFPPQLEPGILAYQIAIDIKRKQNGDYSGLSERRNELWERFISAVNKRDRWQSAPIANAYRGVDIPWR